MNGTLKGRFYLKRDKVVSKAIDDLVVVTSWPWWFAKNVILWRKERKLSIGIKRVVS